MTQLEVRSLFIKYNRGIKAPDGSYWYRCAICGGWCGRPGRNHVKIPEWQKMEVDHIQSWKNGGGDELWNLQAVCKSCNRKKSSNPTLKDRQKILLNTFIHPIDAIATVGRGKLRNNKLLKTLGIVRRK